MQKIVNLIKDQPSILVKNAGWLLSVEGVAKISRIVTILSMTAFLTPTEYGIAILAVSFHDLFRMLMRSGTGNQVVQCSEKDLPSLASNAASLQWIFCIAIALLQFSIAPVLSAIYNNPHLTPLLQLMAASYLLYPWVSIRVYLLHRDNNMKYFSLSNGMCIIAENLSIAVLLWFDFGIEAVAFSKIVFAIFWLGLFIRLPKSAFGIRFNLNVIKILFSNSTSILATELTKAGRHHADTFIAARILSPETFGIYAFAKNAGVGLSQSLINAYNGALFPYLSELNRNPENQQSKKTIFYLAGGLSVVFVLQSAAVPVYVPILFNESWQAGITIVSLLCLTAIPNLYLDTYCCYLRAAAQYKKELFVRMLNLIACVFLLLSVKTYSLIEFSILAALTSCIWLIPLTFTYFFTQYSKPILTNTRS